MEIHLTNAGMTETVNVNAGARVSDIRNLTETLEDIGVPSNFSIVIDGQVADENTVLTPGLRLSFRPITGIKGAKRAA